MESSHALRALAALAQASRLEVFRRLVRAGPVGLAPGELALELGLPAPTLSFHLAQLKAAGLVSARREGRSLRYAADYAAMNELVGFLLENCCGAPAGRSAPACTPSTPSCEARAKAPARRARGARHEASSRPRRGR